MLSRVLASAPWRSSSIIKAVAARCYGLTEGFVEMASQSNSDSIVSLTHAKSFLPNQAIKLDRQDVVSALFFFFFFLTRYILMDFPGLKDLV